MSCVLITGANRGIGLEFTKHFAKKGWKVFATCRNPERAEELNQVEGDVHVHELDVTNESQIKELAASLNDEAIDILINNAGLGGPRDSYDDIDQELWHDVFRVNCMAPISVSAAFVEHVARSEKKIIANISSKMGSIDDNGSGGRYIYRSSKSALNSVSKSLSIDLLPREITVIIFHPGWVLTDMGGPNALIDTGTSILGMATVLDHVTLEQTGTFFNFDGGIIPW